MGGEERDRPLTLSSNRALCVSAGDRQSPQHFCPGREPSIEQAVQDSFFV